MDTNMSLPRRTSSGKSYIHKSNSQLQQVCSCADGKLDGHGDDHEETQQQQTQAARRPQLQEKRPSS